MNIISALLSITHLIDQKNRIQIDKNVQDHVPYALDGSNYRILMIETV